MSVGVVEQLEIIDIQHQDSERTLGTKSSLQLLVQDLLRPAVIGQTGQRINIRELEQCLLILAQTLDHLVESSGQVPQLIPPLNSGRHVQVALSDTLRALDKKSDRSNEMASQKEPQDRREHHSSQQGDDQIPPHTRLFGQNSFRRHVQAHYAKDTPFVVAHWRVAG